jgi:hypothetical protein
LNDFGNRPAKTLRRAVEEIAKDRREALTEKGEVQPEDLPSRFRLPWTDLAAAVCGVRPLN